MLQNDEKQDEIEEVTNLYTTQVTLFCPHCESKQHGFLIDPSGHKFECDECGKPYRVSPHADIEYEP